VEDGLKASMDGLSSRRALRGLLRCRRCSPDSTEFSSKIFFFFSLCVLCSVNTNRKEKGKKTKGKMSVGKRCRGKRGKRGEKRKR
jgi:hypothetical protein